MHRLSNGTQWPTPPANPGVLPNTLPGGAAGPGYPLPGNAATGTPGSVRDAFLDYTVFEELAYLVERRNIALDKSNLHQIGAALDAAYSPRGTVASGSVAIDYTPASGNTYQNTLTFTPAVAGLVVATGIINVAGSLAGTGGAQQQPVGCSHQVVIGGNSVAYASTVGSMSLQGIALVAAGVAIQVVQQYAALAGVTSPWVQVDQRLTYFFIPT